MRITVIFRIQFAQAIKYLLSIIVIMYKYITFKDNSQRKIKIIGSRKNRICLIK